LKDWNENLYWYNTAASRFSYHITVAHRIYRIPEN